MLVNIPYMEHSGLANISMPDPGISGISCSINAEKKSIFPKFGFNMFQHHMVS